MIHLGLIGHPLGHSLSPKIHAAALQTCGLAGDYSLFPISPEDRQGLGDLLSGVRSGKLLGLNVTIPHKRNVIAWLDDLTPAAEAIGAVNTIALRENKLLGDNTDAPGFLSDLKRFLVTAPHGDDQFQSHRTALVLGAGGSARAVVYALRQDGWEVTVAARRLQQAQGLAMQFEGVRATELSAQALECSSARLLVNTTPLGMSPDAERSPVPDITSLPEGVMIYDLVYNPRQTKLVRDARARGIPATTGLGMLIEQAALAFEQWTGHNPPRTILCAAVVE